MGIKGTTENLEFFVEMHPPKGTNLTDFLIHANELKNAGASYLNITDNPFARMRISSMALASITQKETGIDCIMHYTCRDRNILAVQSDLLGAWALGVKNILVLTGDSPAKGDHPDAKCVYELNSDSLIKLIKGMNNGFDAAGNQLNGATNFKIAAAANPGAHDMDVEMAKLKNRIECGADFILTQPIFEPQIFINFIKRVREFSNIPVVAGVLPLISYENAEFLNSKSLGIEVPENVLSRMRDAGHVNNHQVGEDISVELISEIKNDADGIYLMPQSETYSMALAIIRRINNE